MDEDERVWLYYGSAFQMGGSIFKALGGAVIELDRDMLTPISAPKLTVPNIFHQKGTTFKGHAFFEASSMRKIKGKYYFIYSSMLSNELCYAISERPDGPFTYGGIIVSNGDVGLNGNKLAVYPTGNNHGSVECINGKWYVFYHRHTQGSAFSRQGCAEPIEIETDSRIRQVAITSCGLNGVALIADGKYPAGICCYLTDTKKWKKVKPACVDEEYEMGSPVSFVSNLKSDSVVGYKYFELNKSKQLTLYVRLSLAEVSMMKSLATNQCRAEGRIEIYSSVDREPIAKKNLVLYAGDWETVLVDLPVIGNTAL